MTRRCMRLLVTLALAVAPLLETLLPSRPRAGEGELPDASAWFFEIDGDYKGDPESESVLGPASIPSPSYTIPSRNITDGEGSARYSTYAPREGYAVSGLCAYENSGLGNVRSCQ